MPITLHLALLVCGWCNEKWEIRVRIPVAFVTFNDAQIAWDRYEYISSNYGLNSGTSI